MAEPKAYTAQAVHAAPFHLPGVGTLETGAQVVISARLAASDSVVEAVAADVLVLEPAKASEKPQFDLPEPVAAPEDPTDPVDASGDDATT